MSSQMSIPRLSEAKHRVQSWLYKARDLWGRRPVSASAQHRPLVGAPAEQAQDNTQLPVRLAAHCSAAQLAAQQTVVAPALARVSMDADFLGVGDHRRLYLRDVRHANRFFYWPDLFRLKRSSTWPFDPLLTFDREHRVLSLEFEPYTSIERLKAARAQLIELVPAQLSAIGATLELAPISVPGHWWLDPARPCPLPVPNSAPQIFTDKAFVVRWQLPADSSDKRQDAGTQGIDRYDHTLAHWLAGTGQPAFAIGQRAARVRVMDESMRAEGHFMDIPVLDSLQVANRHMYESTVVQTPGSPMVTLYLRNKAAEPLVFRNPCVWLRRAGRRGLDQLTPAPIKPTGSPTGWRLAPLLPASAQEGGLEIAPGHTLTLPLVPARPIDGDGPLEAVLDEGYVSCRSERQRVLDRLVQTLEVAQ